MTESFSDSTHLSEFNKNRFQQISFNFFEHLLQPEKFFTTNLRHIESEESERSEVTMDLHTLAGVIIPSLDITEKTRYTYTWAFNRHFGDLLGRRSINEITRLDVERVISPLPNQSGYQALMVIKTLFREAHERGWVDENPTKGIRAPRIRTAQAPFLTWDQVRDGFFGNYDNHIRFLALHGLRWGEAVALTEDDIKDGLVHVTRSVHGATKTQAGVRTVPYLGHFEQFPATRKPLAKALKPYGVNIHSLRKTYAYILKSNNVHVTTAQKLLGHASPMVTLSIYTKVLDQETLDTGIKLTQSLGLTF
jgi:integrase